MPGGRALVTFGNSDGFDIGLSHRLSITQG